MKVDNEIVSTWKSFHKARKEKEAEKSHEIKNKLIEYYVNKGLLKKIADRMCGKLSNQISSEECQSYGVDGLYEAIEKFDPDRNVKFETFAQTRIWGSIMDNIRRDDWTPRLTRSSNSKLNRMLDKFYAENGRDPTVEEGSSLMKMTQEEYRLFVKKSTPVDMNQASFSASYDETDFDSSINISDVPKEDEDATSSVLREEFFNKLFGRGFTKLERQIVYHYYYDKLSFKEISNKTGLSESRISQMHKIILPKIQRRIELNPKYIEDIECILGNN